MDIKATGTNYNVTNYNNGSKIEYFNIQISKQEEIGSLEDIKRHLDILKDYYKDDESVIVIEPNNYTSKEKEKHMKNLFFTKSLIDTYSHDIGSKKLYPYFKISSRNIFSENIKCPTYDLFKINFNETVQSALKNNILTNIIQASQNLNRTLNMIPWPLIQSSDKYTIPNVQIAALKVALLSTIVSSNNRLIKFYSGKKESAQNQQEALKMGTLARSLARYALDTCYTIQILINTSPGSSENLMTIPGLNLLSSNKLGFSFLKNLSNNTKQSIYYNCSEFFLVKKKVRNIFCSTLYLSLVLQLKCKVASVGILNESLLGIMWLERLNSTLFETLKLLEMIWYGYFNQLPLMNEQYIPPKPFISWSSVMKKIHIQFKDLIIFHNAINKLIGVKAFVPLLSFMSSMTSDDMQIKNLLENQLLKDSLFPHITTQSTNSEFEHLFELYRVSVKATNIPHYFKDTHSGSLLKLNSSLISLLTIIGSYSDHFYMEAAISSLNRSAYENNTLPEDLCRDLTSYLSLKSMNTQSKFTNVFLKLINCSYFLQRNITYQIGKLRGYEISRRMLRKFILNARNKLHEKSRELALSGGNLANMSHKTIKVMSSIFEIISGTAKIIRSDTKAVILRVEKLQFTLDSLGLALEKMSVKVAVSLFSSGKLNNTDNSLLIPFQIIPLRVSINDALYMSQPKKLKVTIKRLYSKIAHLSKVLSHLRSFNLNKKFKDLGENDVLNRDMQSRALYIFSYKNDLVKIYELVKILSNSLQNVVSIVSEPFPHDLLNPYPVPEIYLGRDGYCGIQRDKWLTHNSTLYWCQLYIRSRQFLRIDELYQLFLQQSIALENLEKSVLIDLSILLSEMWPTMLLKIGYKSFHHLLKKIYLLNSIQDNLTIIYGLSQNSLVSYAGCPINAASLLDLLLNMCNRAELGIKDSSIFQKKRTIKTISRGVLKWLKRLFSKKARKWKQEKNILRDHFKKYSQFLFGLQGIVTELDLYFDVNLQKIKFTRFKSEPSILNLLGKVVVTFYKTTKIGRTESKLTKHIYKWIHIAKDVKEFEQYLIHEFKMLMPLFIQNVEIRERSNIIVHELLKNDEILTNLVSEYNIRWGTSSKYNS
ncbi:hypothetical protein cand_015600 [Cryptosporidium andersoni]|uniref:Uncharacterized protein n=1 Tax=Cryptosporidium andersoni TaxID=117008 RepID=A0A1J4MU88_9CRYT|nr:hypothetical protein cand_015600 [Cryptosporidium andersoni]